MSQLSESSGEQIDSACGQALEELAPIAAITEPTDHLMPEPTSPDAASRGSRAHAAARSCSAASGRAP